MTLDRNCLDISLAFATHKSFQQCSRFVELVQLLYFLEQIPPWEHQGVHGCTAPWWQCYVVAWHQICAKQMPLGLSGAHTHLAFYCLASPGFGLPVPELDLPVSLLCFSCGRDWKWAILLFPREVPGQSKVYGPWVGSVWGRGACTTEGCKKKWIGIPSVAFCFSYSTPMRSDRLQNMVLGDMERHLPPHHSVNPDLDA